METSLTSPDADPAVIVTKPTLKQRWLKRLKRLGWAVVWLGTIIALFYAVENWRGRRAWNAYLEEVKARGDSIEPAAVIPPPVPDAENFALSPIFQEAFEARYASTTLQSSPPGSKSQPGWTQTEQHLRRLTTRLTAYQPRKAPAWTPWQHGGFLDLAAWQTFLQADPKPPQSPALQTPAENFLQALAEYDVYLRELHETKERPYSRFPIRYEDTLNVVTPHYSLLRDLTQLASMRSTARLAAGDREGAYEDLLLAFRLADSLEGDPAVIAALVRRSYLAFWMQPLWEGLARAEWTDEQLASIEQRVAAVNLMKHFHEGVRADRNLWAIPLIEALRKYPDRTRHDEMWRQMLRPSLRKLLGDWYSDPVIQMSLDEITAVILHAAPSGWYDQNKVTASQWNDQVTACVDPVTRRINMDRALALAEDFDRRDKERLSPYGFLETPNYSHFLVKLANTQADLGLARIAIALERHRLRHGDLPEALGELEPDFIPAGGLPQDPASGTLPHYKRLSSNRFTLYFEGWNGKDDGGKRERRRQIVSAPLDPTKGDWPWPTPADSAAGRE